MAKITWQIELDEQSHKIEMLHGYLSSKIEIIVDGRSIDIPKSELPGLLNYDGSHKFNISRYPLEISVNFNDQLGYSYRLIVAGEPIVPNTESAYYEIIAAQLEFNKMRSVIVGPFLILLGIGVCWLNRDLHHHFRYFSNEVSFFAPLPIVIGLYMLLFPNDMLGGSRMANIRGLIVIVLAFAAAIANDYAVSHGMY